MILTTPTISIKTTKITDPCLVHENGVTIGVGLGADKPEVTQNLLSELAEKIPTTINLASKNQLKKIEVIFPFDFETSPDLKQLLQRLDFEPILTGYELSLKTEGRAKNPNRDGNFSDKTPSFAEIRPLLIKQAEFHHAWYPDYYRGPDQIDFKKYQAVIEKDLSESGLIFWSFQDQNIFAGLTLGEKIEKVENIESEARCYELIVDEEIRGKKVGSTLMRQFADTARKKGAQKVFLETGFSLPANIFYQRMGFKPINSTWYLNL